MGLNIGLFEVIINRDDIDLAIIKEIIAKERLDEEKIRVILERKNGLIDLELFEILINYTNNDITLNLILEHRENVLLKDGLLALLINKTKNPALIKKILEHQNAEESVFAACINNKNSSDDSILLAFEKTNNKADIVDDILVIGKEKHDLLLALAANLLLPHEKFIDLLNMGLNIGLFEVIINRDDIDLAIIKEIIAKERLDEEKIRVILEQKNGLMDLDLFTNLINQTNYEENLKLIFNHSKNLLLQDEHLALIISKTADSNFIQQILVHPNVKEKVFLACAQNENTSDSSMDIILVNTKKEETLALILSNRKSAEAVYYAIAQNQYTSKNDLINVIKNTKSLSTISKILEHDHLKDSTDDELYIEILKNPLTSKDNLLIIAEKAHDFKTFKMILEHKYMQLSDANTDLVLEKLINNSNFVRQLSKDKSKIGINILLDIAKKSHDLKLILSILKLNSDSTMLDNLKTEHLEEALRYYLNKGDEIDIKNHLSVKLILPLFRKLEDSRIWQDDDVLNNFIVSNLKNLYKINSVIEGEEYKTKIETAISVMKSPEILAINKIIARLKNEEPSIIWGFFYSSGKEKAMRIEKAILAVPMEERRNILSGKTPAIIKVQEALAEHRNFFSRLINGKVKYLIGGNVDAKRAASSYMDYEKIIKGIKIDEESLIKGIS